MMLRFTLCGLVAVISCVAQEGSQVYISHCMQCHSPTSATHAPTPDELAQTPWQEILKTLETAGMQVQAQSLSREARIAVARYIGKAGGAPALPPMSGFCATGSHPVATTAMWNGWGVDNLNTRFQPAAAAGLTAALVPTLKLQWAFG